MSCQDKEDGRPYVYIVKSGEYSNLINIKNGVLKKYFKPKLNTINKQGECE